MNLSKLPLPPECRWVHLDLYGKPDHTSILFLGITVPFAEINALTGNKRLLWCALMAAEWRVVAHGRAINMAPASGLPGKFDDIEPALQAWRQWQSAYEESRNAR